MNSSLLLILVFSFGLIGCGVKGPPEPPEGTMIGKWEEQFLLKKEEAKKEKVKKKTTQE